MVLSAVLALCGLALALEPLMPDTNAPAYQPLRPETSAPAYQTPPATGTNLFTPSPEKLFSPSVSRLFYEIAYEIIHREDITDSQAEQAIVLLNAAMNLDVSTGFATADMLLIAARPGPARHLQMLYDSLIKYVDKNADCRVATNAARYLLEQLDSRQQREILLGRLIRDIGESNPSIMSELATTLGLLYAEKADDPNATLALAMAYTWNRYNQLAFEKLVELAPEQISPVLYLEYLRLKLRENPLDIDAALGFAQYAQKVQLYDVAADSYQYCADLFRFLYPGKDVPIAFYTDWMTSCYNAPRSHQPRCLQLSEQLRKQGRFDLQIEVLAAKSAAKTGDTNSAGHILETAEQKALQLARLGDQTADYKSLAWFYCFVRPDPERAIDWANKAYSAEPNSPLAAGLLACALAANKQPDLAKPLLDNYPQTQLATFAQAQIQLAAGQKQSAVESLRATIDKDPGSIVAEQARLLLTQQQADYIPIFDTGLILATLKQTVGEQIVPQFVSPDQMLSFQLNIRGNRFSYGNDFDGVITITNNWYEPLVISEDGLCKGLITIDVNVTGDINRRIEKLISTTTRPALPVEPGRSTLVPVRLCTGPLKELLLNHPQASLNIQLTAYLDPVVTSDGSIVSAIPGIKPATVQIERPRVEITTEFLQNRFNSLSKGKQSPKIKAAQLFAGLMLESQDLKSEIPPSARPRQVAGQNPKSEISYKLANADWMAPMLKSALVHGLTDSDWVVKVHSIAAIADLPLDYELTNAAAQGLNDQHWPARMMAVWLLAQKQRDNFAKVLDHTAQYDSSEFVRNMAIAFGAKVPEPTQTLEQPFLKLLQQEPNADSNSIFSPQK
jgi:hypothetical protein